MFLTRSPLSKVEISDLGRNFALLRVAINPFGAIAEMEEVNGGEKVSLPYRPWNKILQRYRFFSTLSRKLCASPWVSKGRVGALHTEVDFYAPIVPRMFWGTTLHEIHAEDCTTFPAQHQARRKGWFWCRPKIGSCVPPPQTPSMYPVFTISITLVPSAPMLDHTQCEENPSGQRSLGCWKPISIQFLWIFSQIILHLVFSLYSFSYSAISEIFVPVHAIKSLAVITL